MPKVSQKEAQKTRERIIQVTLNLLISEGFEALTFTRIAQNTNIGRSSINSHFKKKQDLLDEIRPHITKIIEQRLDFSNGEKIYVSWVLAIEQDREFRKVINGLDIMISSDVGITGLTERLQEDKHNSEKFIYMAIGYAIVNLPHFD